MTEKTQSQLDQEQYEADVQWLMNDRAGRRLMWGILTRTGLYQSSFTGNSTTFFREGQRNVGLRLTRDLQAYSPKRYMEMWAENALPDDFKVMSANGKPETYDDD